MQQPFIFLPVSVNIADEQFVFVQAVFVNKLINFKSNDN